MVMGKVEAGIQVLRRRVRGGKAVVRQLRGHGHLLVPALRHRRVLGLRHARSFQLLPHIWVIRIPNSKSELNTNSLNHQLGLQLVSSEELTNNLSQYVKY